EFNEGRTNDQRQHQQFVNVERKTDRRDDADQPLHAGQTRRLRFQRRLGHSAIQAGRRRSREERDRRSESNRAASRSNQTTLIGRGAQCQRSRTGREDASVGMPRSVSADRMTRVTRSVRAALGSERGSGGGLVRGGESALHDGSRATAGAAAAVRAVSAEMRPAAAAAAARSNGQKQTNAQGQTPFHGSNP